MASKFAEAMKSRAKGWKKAAKAKPRKGSSFGPVDMPDGQFEAVVSAKHGVGEKGKLLGKTWVEIAATVRDGEHKGKEPKNFYVLEGKPVSDEPDAMPTAEEKLVGDLKQILQDIEVEETLESEPEQLEAMLKEINDRSPVMRIGIRNTFGKKPHNNGKHYQDLYFNELLEGGSSGEEKGPEEGQDKEEEGDPEEGGEEEGGEPDDGADDTVAAPAKDDEVWFTPKGGKRRKFVVKTVNQGKQTVTVSDGTKKFSDVAWDSIEPYDGE